MPQKSQSVSNSLCECQRQIHFLLYSGRQQNPEQAAADHFRSFWAQNQGRWIFWINQRKKKNKIISSLLILYTSLSKPETSQWNQTIANKMNQMFSVISVLSLCILRVKFMTKYWINFILVTKVMFTSGRTITWYNLISPFSFLTYYSLSLQCLARSKCYSPKQRKVGTCRAYSLYWTQFFLEGRLVNICHPCELMMFSQ